MKNTPSVRLAFHRTALIALGCAFCAAFVTLPAVRAAEANVPQRLADKAPKLPLTATFEKKAPGQEGPQYTLKLKNDSKEAVKVSAEIHLSVVVHNTDKTRTLPAQVIAAGETWTIPELASLDKVVLKAEGFEPLELVVP